MEAKDIILFVMIFALGAVSISMVYEVSKITDEEPLTIVTNPVEAATQTFSMISSGKGIEQKSPGDHVKESQIRVYDNRVEIIIENATWARYTDTNSMDPFLDEGANGIEIMPNSEEDIKEGDIVAYESRDGSIIIHRVIKIEKDEFGTYFITKGDNNPEQDPERVRFSQIKGILVAIIY